MIGKRYRSCTRNFKITVYTRIGMNIKRSLYTILILALLTFLAGCPSNLSKRTSDFDDSKDSNYYLSKVESSSGNAKTNWQLLAVRALIQENKISQANKLLSSLPSELNSEQQIEKTLSQGEIAVKTGKGFKLADLSINELNNSQLFRYYTIKLAIDKKNKNINAQVQDYIELGKYASKGQQKQILSSTWSFFNKLRVDQIRKITVSADDIILQGWLELNSVYQKNNKGAAKPQGENSEIIGTNEQNQKELFTQAIQDWATRYPNHPAIALVSMLTGEQMLTVADANAKKVALLLPLNGSSRVFGETIRQGYIDAIKYYPQEPQQNIVVLDTTSGALDTLIQQAKEQKVELIVGPLLKSDVNTIKQLAPNIPVLALNKIDNKNASSAKMCFFALSPEDEAIDAANHLFSENKVKPLLLVPQNELGKRVAQSFAKQWSQLSVNSSQAYVQYFGNTKSLSDSMNNNIGIKLVGSPIVLNDDYANSTSSVSNSCDFDAIYIYSSYDELTLLKPMLDMGANKPIGNSSKNGINIYSSSKSHVTNASNDFYYDLNQTQYAEIPLIINQSNATIDLPSNIQKDYSLMRFYAMGVDAWRLANRFNQLNSHQSDLLDGMTGRLSTTDGCEVIRSLSWQQYTYGASTSNSENQ